MENIIIKELFDYEDGIWIEKKLVAVESSFSDVQQQEISRIENSSWWYKYRFEYLYSFVPQNFLKTAKTVDIGGGCGYVLSKFKERWKGICVEIEPNIFACKYAKKRGIDEVFCTAFDETTVYDNSIDQFFLLDVLEHIEDDERFVQCIYNKAAEGAVGIVTTPAFMELWSGNDVISGHFRRYNKEQLVNLFTSNGFSVTYANYFMSWLYFPIKIFRRGFEKIGLTNYSNNLSDKKASCVRNREYILGNSRLLKVLIDFFLKGEIKRKNKTSKHGSSVIIIARKEVAHEKDN